MWFHYRLLLVFTLPLCFFELWSSEDNRVHLRSVNTIIYEYKIVFNKYVCLATLIIVRWLSTKRGPNFALHPIDLKFHILVLDTKIPVEPGCCRLLPPHHPCGGKIAPTLHYFMKYWSWEKNFQKKSVRATPENNLEPLIDHPHLPLWWKVAPLPFRILCSFTIFRKICWIKIVSVIPKKNLEPRISSLPPPPIPCRWKQPPNWRISWNFEFRKNIFSK